MLNICISPYKQDDLDWEIQINKKLRQSVAILSKVRHYKPTWLISTTFRCGSFTDKSLKKASVLS